MAHDHADPKYQSILDGLNVMANEAFDNAKSKGWHPAGMKAGEWEKHGINIPEKLMLVVSEASEALEDFRSKHHYEEADFRLHEPCFLDEETGDLHAKQKSSQEAEMAVTTLRQEVVPLEGTVAEPSGQWMATQEAAARALRKPVNFMSELADIVIRCGDLAKIVGGDLGQAVVDKMEFNATRPFRHGNKTC